MVEKSSRAQDVGGEDLEKRMYRSSLKQVVEFMNATLPPLSESSELKPITVVRPRTERQLGTYKVRDSKKKTRLLMQDDKSYSVRSVLPTRIKKLTEEEEEEKPKKRINKFSERKYNDMKERKKLMRKDK